TLVPLCLTYISVAKFSSRHDSNREAKARINRRKIVNNAPVNNCSQFRLTRKSRSQNEAPRRKSLLFDYWFLEFGDLLRRESDVSRTLAGQLGAHRSGLARTGGVCPTLASRGSTVCEVGVLGFGFDGNCRHIHVRTIDGSVARPAADAGLCLDV